jgi:hypothetical protein
MQVRTPKAPHPMGAAATPEAPSKDPKVNPQSKSRSTQSTPLTTPTRTKVPTHLTKAGQAAQCQVMMGTKRCSNPARHSWPHGKVTVWTCTTHGKRIMTQGTTGYRWAMAEVAYDPTLWGGKVPTPKAPQATPKAPQAPKAKAKAPKAPEAPQATPEAHPEAPQA